MAIPDWVQQSVSDPLMSTAANASYAPDVPAPLPSAAAWQPLPQNPEEAALQAGFVPPAQVAPVAQAPASVASMPEQTMSVAPEPQVSEPMASYQPEAPAQPQALEQQQLQVDPYEQNMQAMLSSYLRPRRIPEKVVKAAETWQQSVPGAMPGQEAQYAAAKEAVQSAEERALFNQQAQLLEKADISDQDARNAYMQGRGYAAEVASIADEQEQRRKVIDDRIGELDRLIEQRSKLQSSYAERNPVRDMSMWTRISIGIGAAGQALAGGENAALSLAMRQIDADMANQRNQVDSLGLEIASKRTLLGDMLQKFRDPSAADHATRAAMLGLYESGYRAQAAKEKSAELRGAMLSAADALAMQREQEKLASLTGEHNTLMKWRPASVVGGGIAGLQKFAKDFALTPEQQRQLMLSAARGDNDQVMRVIGDAISGTGTGLSNEQRLTSTWEQERRVRLPNAMGGGVAYAKDKERATTLQTKLDAVEALNTNFAEMERILRRPTQLISADDRDRLNILAQRNMLLAKEGEGLGAITEADQTMVGPVILQGIENFSIADRMKRLDAARNHFNTRARDARRQLWSDPMGKSLVDEPIRTRKVAR